jgi:hypothetical protein
LERSSSTRRTRTRKLRSLPARTATAPEEIRVIALAVDAVQRRIDEAPELSCASAPSSCASRFKRSGPRPKRTPRVTELLEAIEEIEGVPYVASRAVFEKPDFGDRQWHRVELPPRDVIGDVTVRTALPRTERYRLQANALLGEALVAEATAGRCPTASTDLHVDRRARLRQLAR